MASHQAEPPPFQEAAHCDVCKCSFNTFRRRHHCRCCGRTLCNEHSSNQVALPQFGIFTSVRVCSGCFDSASRLLRDNASNSNVDSAAKKISKLSLGHDDSVSDMGLHPEANAKLTTESTPGEAPQCKCGMPLCICEIVPDPIPLQVPKITVSSPSNTRSRKSTRARQVIESTATSFPSSSIAQSLFFSGGQGGSGVTGIVERPPIKYEANGEGLREAIKNDDVLVVKRLLSEGVDANYCDKQGMSLLHLAALFNRTEIAFVLMDHGASSDRKNAQGETPLDCAPTMLQHKMRRKLEQNA